MSDKHLVLGILAHVDAGKTTLSEAVLYLSGAIRKAGRVDHKDAFLDTDQIERNRGITVFSKEARFMLKDTKAVLVDTPGHADFSAEMERTLSVLDCAVLVISGADGVQSHTLTLWKLLKNHKIPVFVFVNKMDQPGTDRDEIADNISRTLGGGFVKFENGKVLDMEEAAVCSEELMEEYIENNYISPESIKKAVTERKIFPLCFGSALKTEGVNELLETLEIYGRPQKTKEEFAARVFKISRDKQGNRQTHMKITGGCLKTKMLVDTGTDPSNPPEKVDQIRLYSGDSFENTGFAEAGDICTVTGLANTYAGQGLGAESGEKLFTIEPTLTYRLVLPEGTEPLQAMRKLIQLREEDPTLDILWKEELQEIQVKVMGRLELEILQKIIEKRFKIKVAFDEGRIIYKETIEEPVVGIGHFEPLRHYAEVHLLMEPLPAGSGLVFDSDVSEDILDRNWQRLILTHLKERHHPGVLTGSDITDMKITLVAGRAHLKHTEGGDFRQATYRAIRQGLRKANNILLEPMYRFRAELPSENIGRLMSDMQRIGAEFEPPSISPQGRAVMEGKASVAGLGDYQNELTAYTAGAGSFSVIFDGYGPCCDQQKIVEEKGYNPDSDINNPTGSVFCTGGSATYVSWDKVDEAAHIRPEEFFCKDPKTNNIKRPSGDMPPASNEELDAIFLKTYGKSKRDEALRRERLSAGKKRPARPPETTLPRLIKKDDNKTGEYLIIDGYNVLFAWPELKALAEVNLDAARESLLEILQNYGVYKDIKLMVVFDGYRVLGNPGTVMKYDGMEVIFTKEAQTADRYIEEKVYEMAKKHNIKVVTSDKSVQMAALGDGALRFSARDFYSEVTETSEEIRKKLKDTKERSLR